MDATRKPTQNPRGPVAGSCFSSGLRLSFAVFAFEPAYDYFARLLVAGLAIELEEPQIIAIGSFLFGRRGEMRPELCEQLAERLEVFAGVWWSRVSLHE